MGYEIDRLDLYMYVWTYSIVLSLKYIIESTDMLISCHVRNNNYALCQVWIFENKIANITCAYINVNIYYKNQLIK